MGPIAVIDLGELPAGQVSDDPSARPWPHRRWALVALVGLALATVGGSAPAPRPLPMALLDAPREAQVLASGDRLFVIDPPPPPGGRADDRGIAAYRLMDLEPLWRVDLPVRERVWLAGLSSARDTLTLIGDPEQAVSVLPDGRVVEKPPETVAIDAATGAVRWRSEGIAEGWTSGGRLLLSVRAADPGGGVPPGEQFGGQPGTLRAVATDTGETVWSYQMPAGALLSYRYDGQTMSLLAVLLRTGRVELRDLDTGQVRHAGEIEPFRTSRVDGPYAELVGDLLVVRQTTGIAAYGMERFDLRWRIPAHDAGFAPCGTVLCLYYGEQGGYYGEQTGLAVVDPRTGRVKWSDSRWSHALGVGDRLLVSRVDPARGDMQVAAADPDTGQTRRDLGDWQALDWNTADGSVLGYRFDATRAVVARLDPERGPQILGVLHGVSRECWTQDRTLLCRRTDDRVAIWRLPG